MAKVNLKQYPTNKIITIIFAICLTPMGIRSSTNHKVIINFAEPIVAFMEPAKNLIASSFSMPTVLLGSLALFLILRVPIGIALGLGSVLVFWLTDEPFASLALSYYSGLDKLPFIAVPMFLLAGALMEKGGISKRLISISDCFVVS